MAISSGGISTLNPNAPLFIPAALLRLEDFSPEWWELVKTSTWFRDYWIDQNQEIVEEEKNGDDIANLLPESFDLSDMDEFSDLELQLEEVVFQGSNAAEVPAHSDLKEKLQLPATEMDGKAIVRNLSSMKSPKVEPAKYWEKPSQCVTPKYSPRRIQQPR